MSTPGFSSSLWLVRHGQSAWNVAGRIQGQSPRAGSLTPAGRDQAELAARQLAGLASGARAVVASDLARTAETAAIIAGRLGLPLQFDRRLREQDLGRLEGTRSVADNGPRGRPGEVIDQFWDDPYRRPPGGETVAEMYDRVHRTLRRLAAARPGAELIVVTHGGPVRVAMAASLPPPGTPLSRGAVGNASITPWPGPVNTEMVAP
ncbi:MAG TPA: histidine phosphatase family protein [Streptosporangiaceae bacterium]|nr:histidine phosphatase family protein [Streptosporangiaceae bacterium]